MASANDTGASANDTGASANNTGASANGTGASANGTGAWQIGVVAERTGLSMRTLHHWEEMGLVRPSKRTTGGFRLYTQTDVDRIITIRRMKPLGFSLVEMRDLLVALDTLDTAGERAEVRAATDVVVRCLERAVEGRAALEQRLQWAEEFEEVLRERVGS